MSHWLSITPTGVEGKSANQSRSNERRPVWELSALYCFGEVAGEEKTTEEAGEGARSTHFKRHRKSTSRGPLK